MAIDITWSHLSLKDLCLDAEYTDEATRGGTEVTSSPFRDTVKTMEVCETILAQALLAGT